MAKLKLHTTLLAELKALIEEYPDDLFLRGAARTLQATEGALGTTVAIANTASYGAARRVYERLTGKAWTGTV